MGVAIRDGWAESTRLDAVTAGRFDPSQTDGRPFAPTRTTVDASPVLRIKWDAVYARKYRMHPISSHEPTSIDSGIRRARPRL